MKNHRKLFWIVALVLTWLVLVGVANAQSGGESIPAFDVFLASLSGPLLGSAVAIGVSWLVEYWPQYQEIEPKWRQLIYLGICLGFSLGAATLRWALGFAPLTFDPLYWQALWNALATFGVGTLAHKQVLPQYKNKK